MPSNADFGFQVLIGGTSIAEYEKEGRVYVECNLETPFSYKHSVTENVNGEEESQAWPVTPYEVKVRANPDCGSTCYYRVYVDGVKVKGVSLEPGNSRLVKGFRDGVTVRELLFSMPRFAKSETDRLVEERVTKVGLIEIECWDAVLQTSEWKIRRKELDFTQANKKDSYSVTKGQFTMATSKAGRVINPRSEYRCVDQWKRTELRSRLAVAYRMGYELRDMGLCLLPLKIDAAARSAAAEKSKRKSDDDEGEDPVKKRRGIKYQDGGKKGGRDKLSTGEGHGGGSEGGSAEGVAVKAEVDADGWPVASTRNKPAKGSGEPALMIDLTSEDEEEIMFVQEEAGPVIDLGEEKEKEEDGGADVAKESTTLAVDRSSLALQSEESTSPADREENDSSNKRTDEGAFADQPEDGGLVAESLEGGSSLRGKSLAELQVESDATEDPKSHAIVNNEKSQSALGSSEEGTSVSQLRSGVVSQQDGSFTCPQSLEENDSGDAVQLNSPESGLIAEMDIEKSNEPNNKSAELELSEGEIEKSGSGNHADAEEADGAELEILNDESERNDLGEVEDAASTSNVSLTEECALLDGGEVGEVHTGDGCDENSRKGDGAMEVTYKRMETDEDKVLDEPISEEHSQLKSTEEIGASEIGGSVIRESEISESGDISAVLSDTVVAEHSGDVDDGQNAAGDSNSVDPGLTHVLGNVLEVQMGAGGDGLASGVDEIITDDALDSDRVDKGVDDVIKSDAVDMGVDDAAGFMPHIENDAAVTDIAKDLSLAEANVTQESGFAESCATEESSSGLEEENWIRR